MNVKKTSIEAGQGPYERITKECGKGTVDYFRRFTLVDILCRLAEFERIELWPKEIQKRLNQLKEYVKKEMDGSLLKLPCPLGSTVYMIVTTKRPTGQDPYYRFIRTTYLTENNAFRCVREFGKTVFLSKEEAQEVLKILEGNGNG